MKKYYLIAVVLFSSLAYAQDGTLKEQPVNGSTMTVCSYDAVKKSIDLPLSRIADDCKLIHFEDVDDALFKPWFTTVTDKYIGVRQEGRPYKLFSSSGKFLCDVGAVGQGPGEYALAIYDDWIDDKNDLIYLAPMTGDKILVYNISGKFLKNITAPQRLHKPKIHVSADGTLSVVHMAFDGEKAVAFQFDKDGKLIKTLEPLTHLLLNNYDNEIFNTRCSSAFDFTFTNCDTMYQYSAERNKIEPVFNVKFNSSEKPFMQYIKLNNSCIVNVFGKKQIIYADLEEKTSSFVKIKNDFFGGLGIFPSVMTFRNGWFVWNLEPGQLMEEIEKRLKESDCTSQDKEKLTKLLKSLDDNANNVLFLGKLK